jgi:hypothetical protein
MPKPAIVLDLTRPYLLYLRPQAGPDPSAAEGVGNELRYGDYYARNAEPRPVSAVYVFQDGKQPSVGVVFRDGRASPQAYTESEFLQEFLSTPLKSDGTPVFGSIAQLATTYTPAYINWVVSAGP